ASGLHTHAATHGVAKKSHESNHPKKCAGRFRHEDLSNTNSPVIGSVGEFLECPERVRIRGVKDGRTVVAPPVLTSAKINEIRPASQVCLRDRTERRHPS